MNAPSDPSSPEKHAAWLLGVVVFFSFLYFYEGGGWNQNSRFDLLRAIVEQHTLQIDAYHENTEDKAYFKGHYYSDKAPGLVFLAAPFALAARPAMNVFGIDPLSPLGEVALAYVVSACSVALPAALAVVCLFFLGLRFGCGVSGAAFGAATMALATPIWAYSSLFWAHALVGACLVFAFAAVVKLGDDQLSRGQFLWALAVGIAAGWATVIEYPAAPASASMAVFALSQVWQRGTAARWRVVAGVSLGAVVCLAVLLAYLYAAFGSFRPSYSYYAGSPFTFMQQRGYLGLTYPHPDRLLKLLLGCSRGLFFASPVMIAALPGLACLWREKAHCGAALVVASIAAYYFLFNASFYWWKAGMSFGPRYAGACLPLLSLGVSVAWQHSTPAWRKLLLTLAGCSVLIALMVVSTDSQLSMTDSCPLIHSTWPEFWSGQMAMNRTSMLTVSEAGTSGEFGAFNLGQLIGLRGLASLLPLLVVWTSAGFFWRRWILARDRRASGV